MLYEWFKVKKIFQSTKVQFLKEVQNLWHKKALCEYKALYKPTKHFWIFYFFIMAHFIAKISPL